MGATYHVAKEKDKWAIFVGGTGQIACEDRDAAISIAQRAASLLREGNLDGGVAIDIDATSESETGRSRDNPN